MVKNKKKRKNVRRIKPFSKAQQDIMLVMAFFQFEQNIPGPKHQDAQSLVYRTMATTPAAKARPPNPALMEAAPPVEAAGLEEALLEAEEAELLADLVAVLMELIALETAPEAELWWLETAD